jgi:outer membrane protein TolC
MSERILPQFLFISLLALFLCPSVHSAEDASVLQSAADQGEALWGPSSERVLYLNLDDCLQRALRHNSELKIADYEINRARAQYGEAKIIGRPVIEYEDRLAPVPKRVDEAIDSFFSGDITVFNSFKLGIGVPVTTFGKISRAKRLANHGIDAASEKRVKKESEIIFKVTQLYYGVLLAREVSRLVDVAYSKADKEIKKRENEGGTNPVELLKLKIFRSETSKRLQESNKKEILALEALRILLGIEKIQSFDVRKARLYPLKRKIHSFDHYKDLASNKRADLRLLDIGLRSVRLNYELEKYKYAPDLGVGGFFEIGRAPGITGLTATDDFNNPFNFTRAGIGLQLKGKLDIGTRQAKIRQAEAEMLKTELNVALARSGIMLEVKQAYLNLKAAREELSRSEETSKMARQLLFLTQSNYDLGLAEPKDLIDGISQFLMSRGDYFKTVFEYNAAFAELDHKLDIIPDLRVSKK